MTSPSRDSQRAASGRTRIPLHSDDLSSFAKQLRNELSEHHARAAGVPGHVQLLNMLARAAGHRNVQMLKARATASATLPSAPEPTPPAAPTPNTLKTLGHFDHWGRLTRWPTKFSLQRLAMWALWLRFDSGRVYTEREVNEILKAWTVYGDHVTPRRELVEMKLLGRKPDCSAYWKEAQRPDDEVRGLLQALRARRP